MTQVQELKCKDLVQAEFKAEMKRVQKMLNLSHYDRIEAVRSQYLCFDLVEPNTFTDQPEAYYRLQISWGGPSDEFRFIFKNNAFLATQYWYMDWFDGAKVDLTEKEQALIFDLYIWLRFNAKKCFN